MEETKRPVAASFLPKDLNYDGVIDISSSKLNIVDLVLLPSSSSSAAPNATDAAIDTKRRRMLLAKQEAEVKFENAMRAVRGEPHFPLVSASVHNPGADQSSKSTSTSPCIQPFEATGLMMKRAEKAANYELAADFVASPKLPEHDYENVADDTNIVPGVAAEFVIATRVVDKSPSFITTTSDVITTNSDVIAAEFVMATRVIEKSPLFITPTSNVTPSRSVNDISMAADTQAESKDNVETKVEEEKCADAYAFHEKIADYASSADPVQNTNATTSASLQQVVITHDYKCS